MTTDDTAAKPHLPAKDDWFLSALVRLVNMDSGFSPSLTLMVGGTLMSGRLASGRDYFEQFARDIAGAVSDKQAAEAAYKQFSELGAQVYDKDRKGSDDQPSFIHLKGVRVLAGARELVPSTGQLWWRGRLTAVEGFSLGELSVNPPKATP